MLLIILVSFDKTELYSKAGTSHLICFSYVLTIFNDKSIKEMHKSKKSKYQTQSKIHIRY